MNFTNFNGMRPVTLIAAITLVAFAAQVRAQDINVDSVEQVLAKTTSDTARLHILDFLSGVLPDGEWQRYNDQMLAEAERALATAVPEERHLYVGYLASAYNNQGIDLKYQGRTAEAMVLGEKALGLFRELGDSVNIANACYNVGRLYNSQGQIDKALSLLHESLKLYEAIKNYESEVFNLNIIGNIYKDQRELEKAEEYHQAGVKLSIAHNLKQPLAFSYSCLAQVYAEQKRYDLAMENFQKQVQMYSELGVTQDIASGHHNLAGILRSKGDLKKAAESYQTALDLFRQINDTNGESKALIGLGQTYVQMKDYSHAEKCLTGGLALGQKLGYPKDIHMAADGLYQIYKAQHRVDLALEMLELSKKMSDSIQNANTNRAALRSQFKYEYEKRAIADSVRAASQQQVLHAEISQARTQRYLLISSIALLVTAAGFVLYRVRLKQKIADLNFRNKVASDLHDDVGSALSSISIFSEVARQKLGDPTESARPAIEKIGDISRSVLEDMSDIVWAISPNNDSVGTLKERMETFGRSLLTELGIDFRLQIDDRIADLKLGMELRKNLYLIYKEGLNNAVKYSNASRIDVSLEVVGKEIRLHIADNGVGFEEDFAKKGNGLKNMRQRAREIGAMFEIKSQVNRGTQLDLLLKTT